MSSTDKYWEAALRAASQNLFVLLKASLGFQKTDIGVSTAFGARNTNIGFMVRIDDYLDNISSLTGATPEEIRPITLAAAVEISITRPWA